MELIQTRHKVTEVVQAVTPDQLAVFADVLEVITEEEAAQISLDRILNPTPVDEPEAPEVIEPPVSEYPEGDPDDNWKVSEIDAWARDREIELAGNKPEKLARIAEIIAEDQETE